MKKMNYILAVLLMFSLTVYSWEDCPKGLVNDTYPGECGEYVDTNDNGICDHSEEMPATPAVTAPGGTTTYNNISTLVVQKQATGGYNFILISGGLLLLYVLSGQLAGRSVSFGVCTHRKIWNVLLLVSFFATGATGILLAMRLDLRWDIPFIKDLTFWHVEMGIAMTLVAFFHCAWHSKYYISMLNGKRKSK